MQDEAIRFGDAVAAYLEPLRDALKNYRWEMGKGVPEAAQKLGLPRIDIKGGLAATHALRADVAHKARQLHDLPASERGASLKDLCRFVIKTWGALIGNKDETIAKYVATFTSGKIGDFCSVTSLERLQKQTNCSFPFDGISSWSKWLNFVWNDWALIYDARIAFALNAIHFMSGVDARAFPVPTGRDRLLSTIDTQTMAALGYLKLKANKLPGLVVEPASPKADKKTLKALSEWLKEGVIEEPNTYAYYLAVMARVREVMGGEGPHALVECEMLLYYVSNKWVVHDLLASMTALLPSAQRFAPCAGLMASE
jgi:hypothetical protein